MEKKRNLFWVVLITFLFLWVTGEGAAEQLTINMAGVGSGTVTSSPAGINCGGDCSEVYSQGKSITLKAKANADSYFVGWSGGGCTGAKTCKVTMDSDVAVTATFEVKTASISVSPESLDFGTGEVGKKTTKTLTISNNGTGDLIVIASLPADESEVVITGADANIPSGAVVLANGKSKTMTIKPKKSKNVKVTIKPETGGRINTKIILTSNDPRKPVLEVPVEEDLVAALTNYIDFMIVAEELNELWIVGSFVGSFVEEQGKVTIGGKEVAIKQWTDTLVVCDLPTDLAGDVQVATGKLKSNVVPLTSWKGQFRYTYKSFLGTLGAVFTCDVHFRADIHPFIDRPTGQLIEPIVLFGGDRDSTCHYEFSGAWTYDICTTTWSGDGDIPISKAGEIRDNDFYLLGSIDTRQKKMFLFISADRVPYEEKNPCDSLYPVTQQHFTWYEGIYDSMVPEEHFILDLDNQFNAEAGYRGPVTGYEGGSHKIEWDTIPASFPPKN